MHPIPCSAGELREGKISGRATDKTRPSYDLSSSLGARGARSLVSVIMSSDNDDRSTYETDNFCPWASHFMPLTTDNLSGWVSSCSGAEEVRKIFEAAKSIHFIGNRKGGFGTHDATCPTSKYMHASQHHVYCIVCTRSVSVCITCIA